MVCGAEVAPHRGPASVRSCPSCGDSSQSFTHLSVTCGRLRLPPPCPSPRSCPQRTAQRSCRHFTETSSGKVAQKLPSTVSPSGGSEDLPVPPSSPVLPPFRSSLTSSTGTGSENKRTPLKAKCDFQTRIQFGGFLNPTTPRKTSFIVVVVIIMGCDGTNSDILQGFRFRWGF